MIMVIIFGVLFAAIGFIYYYSGPHSEPLRMHGIPLICLFIFLIYWLFFRELQGKAIELTITDTGIITRKFVRISKPNAYLFTSLDGYQTGIINFRGTRYEVLCFVQHGKRVAQISGYYHDNYNALKSELSSRLPFIGEVYPTLF